MKKDPDIPVRLIVTTPAGDVPVRGEAGRQSVPAGPPGTQSDGEVRYAPYLEAVRRFIFRGSCRHILSALSIRLGRNVDLGEIQGVEIRTEKHGYSYQVARVDVSVSGETVSFVVNAAVSQKAKCLLQKEFRLLQRLHRRFNLPYLPAVFYMGSEPYQEPGEPVRRLAMFVGEWFRDFHEFHLHRDHTTSATRTLLWDMGAGYRYLSESQCAALYRQSANILTLYYDWNTFRHIYPWHHAAGDFVVRQEQERVELRLITVRDYVPVVSYTSRKAAAKRLALVLFFLHLTVQMRLDRLDGVGEVVWAPDFCLHGAVAGFFQGLAAPSRRDRKQIPTPLEFLELLRTFTRQDWVDLFVEFLDTFPLSRQELALVSEHGEAHLGELQRLFASLSLHESTGSPPA
ncbi:MAG: hypothetical protein ACLFVT_04200 [Syntrophobacteria bacterium]